MPVKMLVTMERWGYSTRWRVEVVTGYAMYDGDFQILGGGICNTKQIARRHVGRCIRRFKRNNGR